MFDLNNIDELAQDVKSFSNLTTLTSEHCASLLVAESVIDMTRPITRFSNNERIATQQRFNREIALKIKAFDGSTKEGLEEFAKQAAMRVHASRQTDDEEAMLAATQRLEMAVNFFVDLAGNVARNSFYRHEECERQETAAADSNVQGIDGAVGAFETRSKYAGWSNIIVETTTMHEAAVESVDGLLTVVEKLLPFASAYLQGLYSKDGKVHVQLSYRRNGDDVEQFYTIEDVWKDLAANRRQTIERMSAEDAAVAFKL